MYEAQKKHGTGIDQELIEVLTAISVVSKRLARAWKRIRDRYAAEHPLCEMCLKEGRLTPVQEVHHILPVSKGGTHARDNLMSLCQSCHTKIHHDLGDR